MRWEQILTCISGHLFKYIFVVSFIPWCFFSDHGPHSSSPLWPTCILLKVNPYCSLKEWNGGGLYRIMTKLLLKSYRYIDIVKPSIISPECLLIGPCLSKLWLFDNNLTAFYLFDKNLTAFYLLYELYWNEKKKLNCKSLKIDELL